MKRKINPNRMTLLRLRKRLDFARKGHKMLKNKRDKLTQHFLKLVHETVAHRERIEKRLLQDIGEHYLDGRSLMDRQSLEDALELSTRKGTLYYENIYEMNVKVPTFTFEVPDVELSYKLSATSLELDAAFKGLYEAFHSLIELAEQENKLFKLADELEKTRRRVNALEYVLIPDYEADIRIIENKLSDNERSTQTRLMKIKGMLEEQELEDDEYEKQQISKLSQ